MNALKTRSNLLSDPQEPIVLPEGFVLLETVISHTRQASRFRRLLKTPYGKISINIKSDSYSFQSSATSYIWHPQHLCWRSVHSIPYSEMKTEIGLYCEFSEEWKNPKHYLEDYKALLNMTWNILL